jgi:actin-like ATPase involved in cell morphogenesis
MARPSGDGEGVELVRDAQGNDKTPSMVYFGEAKTLVGSEAVNMAVEAAGDEQIQARVIRSIKRQLLEPPRIALPGGRTVTPVEVAAAVLAKLKGDAEVADHGGRLDRVVVTYPAVFDAAQQSAIRDAATLAGFGDVELWEEPCAAAVAFEHQSGQVGQGVLVYDWGGGTFDAALVVREPGEDRFYLALEPDGDAQCGGDDLDQTLYDYFDAQARQQLARPISLDRDTVDARFLQTCRRHKESLSKRPQATFSTMLAGGVRFSATLDRATLEELIAAQVDRTIHITQRTLNRAGQAGYLVDTVLLVGGSSQLPLVQRRITQELGLRPQSWRHRDVAVALGAAWHAQAIWGRPARRSPVQDPRQLYQRSVELVWSDARLEAAEAQQLDALRRKLGLSPQDAAQIERQVIGHPKDYLLSDPLATAQQDATTAPAPAGEPAIDDVDQHAAATAPSPPSGENVPTEPEATAGQASAGPTAAERQAEREVLQEEVQEAITPQPRWKVSNKSLLIVAVLLAALVSMGVYTISSENDSGQSGASTTSHSSVPAHIVHQGTKEFSAGDNIDLQTGEITTYESAESELTACCESKLTAIRSSAGDALVAPTDVMFDSLGMASMKHYLAMSLIGRIDGGKIRGADEEISPPKKGIMIVDCDGDDIAKVQVLDYLPEERVKIRWVTYGP